MNAVIMGLGEIGRGLVKATLEDPRLQLLHVVDKAPALAGKTLDTLVAGAPALKIHAELPPTNEEAVLLHAAGSYLKDVLGPIAEAVTLGYHVVSTCEELADPGRKAMELDALCQRQERVVVGVGVNPGFVFDRLPALMAHTLGQVESVHGVRVVDTRTRRLALQKKTGAGMTKEAFAAAVKTGLFGHVGLSDSARLAARACRLNGEEVKESIEPVLGADGLVAGLRQIAVISEGGKERVRLDLTMALGAPNPRDEITLQPGDYRLLIPGGTPGERATFWTTVHAAALVGTMSPGVKTVLDLPLSVD